MFGERRREERPRILKVGDRRHGHHARGELQNPAAVWARRHRRFLSPFAFRCQWITEEFGGLPAR
jgi:hypothetical protein